jgi:hypothetical protein
VARGYYGEAESALIVAFRANDVSHLRSGSPMSLLLVIFLILLLFGGGIGYYGTGAGWGYAGWSPLGLVVLVLLILLLTGRF